MARDELARGPERLRVRPWRGDPSVATLVPLPDLAPPTSTMVRHCCDVLAERGYRAVLSAALSPREQRGFVDAGFAVSESLHLLTSNLADLADPSVSAALRRGRRRDRPRALAVDAAAFPPFWRLDAAGFDDAMAATPVARFRVSTAGRDVVGYAVAGRAGPRGYLQRLAVDPDAAREGRGRALVLDALRWMRRRGCTRGVVNTQVGNDHALHLYTSLGFRLEPEGLAVLGRSLVANSRPTPPATWPTPVSPARP